MTPTNKVISERPYFYHSNHLGSSAWITNNAGTPVQSITYLPYGKVFINQQSTSYDAVYKFIGKERDSETGYDLLDNRYYSSDLGMFISTDPLAHLRSWLTPYNYSQNSPINRSDPSGLLDDGYINGKAAGEATAQLQSGMKNIKISRDETSGKLSYTGTAKTRQEKQIARVMDDSRVKVNINAENSDIISKNSDGSLNKTNGGSFMGNEVIMNPDGSKNVNTFQYVNPQMLAEDFDINANYGDAMKHEFTESYMGGKISLKNGYSSPKANVDGSVFGAAHNMALPQPRWKYDKTPSKPSTIDEIINNMNNFLNIKKSNP